jgi:hypothetical protein
MMQLWVDWLDKWASIAIEDDPRLLDRTGCQLKFSKPETEKNDLHGALRCVAQREFPCGVTKLP